MAKDYYEILGVQKNATKEEIKKAYKKLAKKYHPDISKEPDAETKFKEASEAAAILTDDKKRQQFDQFGSADFSGFQGGMGGFDFGGGFEDIFENIMGGFGFGGRRGRRRGPKRGSDLIYEMRVDLKDAATGIKRDIVIPKLGSCETCSGKGAVDPNDIQTCGKCNGAGIVKVSRRTPFGVFSSSSPCNDCQGQGQIFKNACSSCHGSGRVKVEKTVSVTIPAGVDTGVRLRVSGEGEAGERGAQSGDLYVEMYVPDHDFFQRDGENLYCEVPISFALAALGGDIEVQTLIGDDATLKIPSGTQTGTVFRLKDLGMPRLQYSGQGSQMVRVNIEVPKKISSKQKELLRQFEKETKDGGFFKKLFKG